MPKQITIRFSDTLIRLIIELASNMAQSIGSDLTGAYIDYYINILPHLAALYPIGVSFGIKPEHNVLEVGSGLGTKCILGNAIWNANFIGLEPAVNSYSPLKKAIKEFKAINPDRTYTSLDAAGEDTGLDSESVDFVLSFDVIEHVDNPEKVINEIYRVLKPESKIFLSTVNYRSFYEGHYRCLWLPFLGDAKRDWWVKTQGYNPSFLKELNFITKSELLKYIKNVGFRNIRLGYNYLPSPLPDLRVILPDEFNIPMTAIRRQSHLQTYIQQPKIHNILSIFGMEYKICLEAEK